MGRGRRARARKRHFAELTQVIDEFFGKLVDPINEGAARKRIVAAHLLPPKASDLKDSCASRPPKGYYVILGRGTAATVNLTTLRQSKSIGAKRLDHEGAELPVVMVGQVDPWWNYENHAMGQPAYLLSLPGYHHPVTPDSEEKLPMGCSSKVFAQSTRDELNLLHKHHPFFEVTGWVGAIQAQANPEPDKAKKKLKDGGVDATKVDDLLALPYESSYPRFRLVVVGPDGTPRFLYAWKIDICTGSGLMNIEPRDTGVNKDFFKPARTPPWLPVKDWVVQLKDRRVLHGMDGLTEAFVWDPKWRICVYGHGGIGLNQVERAHDIGCCLDWYSRATHHGNGFALPRNDTVLRGSHSDPETGGSYMNAGEASGMRKAADQTKWDLTFPLFPGNPRWRFADYAKVIDGTASNVDVKPVIETKDPGGTSRIVDHWTGIGSTPPLAGSPDPAGWFPFSTEYARDCPNKDAIGKAEEGKAYDYLILTIGQNVQAPGEPSSLTEGITLDPIKHDGDRAVGLISSDQHIRVLGAAATQFPGKNKDSAYVKQEEWRGTLPCSAVPPGFLPSGYNIAAANGFFDDHPCRNVNTLSRAELIACLQKAPASFSADDATKLAETIIKLRQWPNNGIKEIGELVVELATDPATQSISGLSNLNGALKVGYPDPDPWDNS